MRIFFAGATGAVGMALLPRLLREGHDVVALVRNEQKAQPLQALGATTALADPLDRSALIEAVTHAQPDLVLHQLTALSHARGNFKKFDEEFALTNRFRTEVTDTLLEGSRKAGARRFIAQSFCGWPFARVGGPVKTEEDALDPDPPRAFRKTLAAIRYLEDRVSKAVDLEACALRYGLFYGPGTSISTHGLLIQMVRKRRFPIVGSGSGVWSFIHIDDAATATLAAISSASKGLFNIVDDEPASVSQWLPFLAQVLGARKPWTIPTWLARPLIGDAGVSMMTEIRGGSNAKAKRELVWKPRFATWRQGFVEGLG